MTDLLNLREKIHHIDRLQTSELYREIRRNVNQTQEAVDLLLRYCLSTRKNPFKPSMRLSVDKIPKEIEDSRRATEMLYSKKEVEACIKMGIGAVTSAEIWRAISFHCISVKSNFSSDYIEQLVQWQPVGTQRVADAICGRSEIPPSELVNPLDQMSLGADATNFNMFSEMPDKLLDLQAAVTLVQKDYLQKLQQERRNFGLLLSGWAGKVVQMERALKDGDTQEKVQAHQRLMEICDEILPYANPGFCERLRERLKLT